MTLQSVVQSPYFTLGIALLALLSIILAIVFFRKSQRRKKPLYEIARRTVIENSTPIIPGLSVHFNGEEQPRITVAHLWFWNQGADTIRSTDIADASPLGIEIAEGATILSAQVIRVTDTANQCRLGKPTTGDDGAVFIPLYFNYIDQQDGVVVQIIHNAEAKHRISMCGKIMGVNAVEKAADAFAFHVEARPQMAQMMRFLNSPRLIGVISIAMFSVVGIVLCVQAVVESKWLLILPALPMFLLTAACYPLYLRSVIPKRLVIDLSDAQQDKSSGRG